jgi:hypothetical protein
MEPQQDFRELPATPPPETWTTTQDVQSPPVPDVRFGVNDPIGIMLHYAAGGP